MNIVEGLVADLRCGGGSRNPTKLLECCYFLFSYMGIKE